VKIISKQCTIRVDLITRLLENLQHKSVEVQIEACMALSNLATLPDAHEILIKGDGI
jgi:hypothetical protein